MAQSAKPDTSLQVARITAKQAVIVTLITTLGGLVTGYLVDQQKTSSQFASLNTEKENLKKELSQSQTPLGKWRINDQSFWFLNSQFSVDACKAAAIDNTLSRAGEVVQQGPGWVDVQFGGNPVSFDCDLMRFTGNDDLRLGVIIVTGSDLQKARDLGSTLHTAIVAAVNSAKSPK
jgi:hypothetical protein